MVKTCLLTIPKKISEDIKYSGNNLELIFKLGTEIYLKDCSVIKSVFLLDGSENPFFEGHKNGKWVSRNFIIGSDFLEKAKNVLSLSNQKTSLLMIYLGYQYLLFKRGDMAEIDFSEFKDAVFDIEKQVRFKKPEQKISFRIKPTMDLRFSHLYYRGLTYESAFDFGFEIWSGSKEYTLSDNLKEEIKKSRLNSIVVKLDREKLSQFRDFFRCDRETAALELIRLGVKNDPTLDL